MKPVLLFFLCFSFLLLSGCTLPCSPVCSQGIHTSSTVLLKERQQSHTFSHSKNNSIQSTNGSDGAYGFANAIEPEDNDDEHKLPVRILEYSNYFFQLFRTHLSNKLNDYRKGLLSACLHFALMASDKYITYGAIRI